MTPPPVVLLAACLGAVATPLILAAARAAQPDPTRPAPSSPWRTAGAVALLATAAAALCWRLGPGHALAAAPLLLLGVPAALVDWREARLPDILTAALAVVTAATLGLLSLVEGDPAAVVRAAIAGAGAGAGLLLLGLLRPAMVGLGDIKFAPSLAAYLGWSGWPTVYLGAAAWWLLLAAMLLARCGSGRERQPGEAFAFGPAMLAATILAMLALP